MKEYCKNNEEATQKPNKLKSKNNSAGVLTNDKQTFKLYVNSINTNNFTDTTLKLSNEFKGKTQHTQQSTQYESGNKKTTVGNDRNEEHGWYIEKHDRMYEKQNNSI